jgi:hypothetical protein
MSRLVSRILLTILLFPSAALFLLVAFIFLERSDSMSDETAITISTLATALYMAGYWLLLWHKSVVWTSRRVRLSWWCGAGATICGAALGGAIKLVMPYNDELAIFVGILVATVLWIIASICIWRETPAERAGRLSRAGADAVVCPTCGYNLTGLHEARCPECGAQFTLDELLASQPNRAAAELETH